MKARQSASHEHDAVQRRHAETAPAAEVELDRPQQHLAEHLHNSPRMVAQLRQTAALYGPAAVQPADSSAPLQRKVRVKDGATYENADIRPSDSAGLRAMKSDAKTHLLLSQADFDQLGRGDPRGVRRLTPHRHVIGEHHALSRFNQAVADWGFGAPSMREALSDNPRLKHIRGDEARADRASENFGALPLEDTTAKNLAVLAGAHELLFNMQRASRAYGGGVWVTVGLADRDHFLLLAEAAEPRLGELLDVATNLLDYVSKAPSLLSRMHFGSIDPAWAATDKIKAIVTDAAFVETLNKAQRQIRAQRASSTAALEVVPDTFIALSGWSSELMDCLDAIHAQIAPAVHARENVSTQIGLAKASGIDPMNALREHYMAANIGTLPLPGLAKVGRHHRAGLAGRGIVDAVLYDDYADFVAATEIQGGNFWDADLKRSVDFSNALDGLERGCTANQAVEELQPLMATMRAAWRDMNEGQREAVRMRTIVAIDNYFWKVLRRRPSQQVQAEEMGFAGLVK